MLPSLLVYGPDCNARAISIRPLPVPNILEDARMDFDKADIGHLMEAVYLVSHRPEGLKVPSHPVSPTETAPREQRSSGILLRRR